MIGEVHEPIEGKPGQVKKIDDEYVRNGVAEIFIEVEPLAGKRHVAISGDVDCRITHDQHL
jgi:hypothetical protein